MQWWVVSGDTATNSAGGVEAVIDGHGYITLNADGSYTYVSTADAVTADAQDVFTYTVRDADGDLSHSTLTINVANVNLTPAPLARLSMKVLRWFNRRYWSYRNRYSEPTIRGQSSTRY